MPRAQKKSVAKTQTKTKTKTKTKRTLDARPDTTDFRDLMFVPTLREVATNIPIKDYLKVRVPVLNQGSEGACTGFGLATVANYLLLRRLVVPDPVPVSPRMLYEMARRYDEWPGENYSGSSARGAMKGWHKHGVCAEKDWPYHSEKGDKKGLTDDRTSAALRRPLGAYFRVNHHDLIAMHTAIAEVGILYATATVHSGWDAVADDGIIKQSKSVEGGHAFAIVAYDAEGFWIQNSWGVKWGKGGLGRISYDDWLANGTDVWVARLGAPVTLRDVASTAIAHAATSGQSAAYAYADVRPHIVCLGNNGELQRGGNYGTSPDELRQIFEDDIPRVITPWSTKRVLLYAHGGLVGQEAAVQRIAEYRKAMLGAEVYPLAFIWNSDYWSTITNILEDSVRRRRPEGILDAAKDFMLDRLDDALEPIARVLTGKASWSEMKENALGASRPSHGADLVLKHLEALTKKFPGLEIHIVGHSAGSILHAPIVQLLTSNGTIKSGPARNQNGLGLKVTSCTLWAPACTMELFEECYLPAIKSAALGKFVLFVLSDQFERDDHCANIYNKSLLYLVSNAFEGSLRAPLAKHGVALLGMETFVRDNKELSRIFANGSAELIIAPNPEAQGTPNASGARHHGDFDDDLPTVMATLARIAGPAHAETTKGVKKQPGADVARAPIQFQPSNRSLRARRIAIDEKTKLSH